MHTFLQQRAQARAVAASERASVLRAEAGVLARRLLEEPGVTHVWLFGSLAWGTPHTDSDIDLAAAGLSEQRYFRLLGELLMNASVSVDLVRLEDVDENFRQRILEHGVPL